MHGERRNLIRKLIDHRLEAFHYVLALKSGHEAEEVIQHKRQPLANKLRRAFEIQQPPERSGGLDLYARARVLQHLYDSRHDFYHVGWILEAQLIVRHDRIDGASAQEGYWRPKIWNDVRGKEGFHLGATMLLLHQLALERPEGGQGSIFRAVVSVTFCSSLKLLERCEHRRQDEIQAEPPPVGGKVLQELHRPYLWILKGLGGLGRFSGPFLRLVIEDLDFVETNR
mmetsp:Transcript_18533/g.70118  ORF Transcript_18533/g.70118 Transcript_18533/m.70118 type:complete len:227 (+) Transcript_18533:1448-2128(+)